MRQHIVVLLLPVLFLVSCGVRSSSDSYAIAYNVLYDEQNDDYEIFVMNMDGSNKQNISNQPGVEWTYAAYGNRILFISDRDTTKRVFYLYEMDARGRNVRKIYDVRLTDSWMATRNNGSELIVRPHPSVDSAFHIITASGDLVRRVVTGLPSASDPTFIEAGRRIVFRGGTKSSKREEGYEEALYVINEDGSDRQKLTEYPSDDTTAPWYAYRAGPPMWNAGEGFISYMSFQNGTYSLFAVRPDGSGRQKLTDNVFAEAYHSWSPDGKWLVMDVTDPGETRFDIGLMNWETKEVKILTDTSYTYQQSPVFVRK